MLCQGNELYGVGTIQKLYAQGAKDLLFVCFAKGHLWDWLGQNNARRVLIEGHAELVAGKSSLAFLTKAPKALATARRHAATLEPIARKEGITILHTHWLPQQLVAGVLRHRGFRSVWQINNLTSRTRLMGLGIRLNHAMAKWGADLLLPCSDYIAGNWRASRVPTITVRNAGVPLYMSANTLPPGALRAVIAGRLEHSKGHHLAVEAVLSAREQGHDITLDLFGGPMDNNPYATDLKARVAATPHRDHIRFMGFRTDLRQLHQTYHVGMQCRVDPEPCSLWVCEAHLDGLPLLAAANGGTPELVADGVTGLLFTSGDAQHLTRQLITLANDRPRLDAMRAAAFVRGQDHFTLDRFIANTAAAYATLKPAT